MSNGLNVGELIAALEKHDFGARLVIDGSPVMLSPEGFDSYRGYYEQLAINVGARHCTTVGIFAHLLKSSVGTTMTGYKGDVFPIQEDTPVWISNDGECSGARVTGVRECKLGVAITWEFAR